MICFTPAETRLGHGRVPRYRFAICHAGPCIAAIVSYRSGLAGRASGPLWSYTPPNTGALVSTPAVANGLVFVGSTNDNLYAIRA